MAEEEARVRLELAASGMSSELRRLERDSKELSQELEGVGRSAQSSEKKMSPAFASMKKGLGAAKSALGEMGGAIKSTLGQAATLGGALSAGAGVHNALALTERYRKVADSIERATGKAMDWENVQAKIETAADASNRTNEEMLDAFDAIRGKTGDAAAAFDQLDTVAVGLNATKEEAKSLGTIMGVLAKSFPEADLNAAMANVIGHTDKGRISFEEMSEDLNELASIATLAGQKGEQGLGRILGIATHVNKDVKNMSETMTGLDQLFEKVRQTPVVKGLGEAGGFKQADITDTDDGVERVKRMLEIAGDHGAKQFKKFQTEALETEFTGREEQVAFETLAKPFREAYEEALEQGKSATEASKAGAAAFDKSLSEIADASTDYSTLQKQASEEMKSPQAAMREAMKEFGDAFTKPEMIDAIHKFAKAMPKIAEMAADLVGFAADHPMLAGVGALGARPAMAAGASMGGDLIAAGGKKVWAQAAGEFTAAAATSGKWKAAGTMMAKVAGPLMVGALVFELGRRGIDKHFDTKAKHQGTLATTGAEVGEAIATGDKGKMREAHANVQAKIKAAREDNSGFSKILDNTWGGLAKLSGADVNLDDQENAIARAEAEARRLEEAMAKGAGGGDKVAESMEKAATAAEKAAKEMEKIGKGGGGKGTNGLPKTPGSGNGSTGT